MLEHALLVGDVRAVLAAPDADPPASFSLDQLAREEYGLRSEPGADVECRVFRPDGLFLYSDGTRRLAAFLEADRENLSVRRWISTMAGYTRYVRLGHFSETYSEAEPVVLVVTTGAARIAVLARETAGMDSPRVFYSTIDALREDGPRGCFWTRSPGTRGVSVAELLGGIWP